MCSLYLPTLPLLQMSMCCKYFIWLKYTFSSLCLYQPLFLSCTHEFLILVFLSPLPKLYILCSCLTMTENIFILLCLTLTKCADTIVWALISEMDCLNTQKLELMLQKMILFFRMPSRTWSSCPQSLLKPWTVKHTYILKWKWKMICQSLPSCCLATTLSCC